MRLTVWTNHAFRPEALAVFEEGLRERGHQMIISPAASPVVLAAGKLDESLAQADIAYGQPDVAQVMQCPRLKWIALSTAGYTRYDRADFRAAMKQRGVPVTNASQVFADPCAQHALAQMLALERNLPAQLRNQDGPREWRYLEDRFTAGVLTNRRVLLLGYGAIARRLVELLRPFGCHLSVFRRRPDGKEGVRTLDDTEVDREIDVADHIVNLLPDNEDTRGWMSAPRFLRMKRTARFYNIGRGTTVDQQAMQVALNTGHIEAAYLDVMDPEPLPADHPLWKARNCHITCHIAGGTREQDENLAQHFLTNLQAFTAGGSLVDRIV